MESDQNTWLSIVGGLGGYWVTNPTSHGLRGFVAQAKARSWGVLAEVPGRKMVFGAVSQPSAANIIFRALPPHERADFHESGYAKIVCTIPTDSASSSGLGARTETRVRTVDPVEH